MSLWDEYRKEHIDDALVGGVPGHMEDIIETWVFDVAKSLSGAYLYAQSLRSQFRINIAIPTRYARNYSDPPEYWKFARFLLQIAKSEPHLFFVLIDYMFSQGKISEIKALRLQEILNSAGHEYMVRKKDSHTYELTQRVPATELELMSEVLTGANIYSSEFRDAFTKLYGLKPDATGSVGEAFQATESALKFYLGDDKGKNLGAILGWLKDHQSDWVYKVPSDDQTNAGEQFLANIDFVNKAGRKIKYGQAHAQLAVASIHAAVVIRVVALIIHELEYAIELVENQASS